jgi:hypothetical protein
VQLPRTFVIAPLVAALATAIGGHRALWLHDLLGEMAPKIRTDTIVVETHDATADEAVRRSREAGARGVYMALPAGHPWLAGASPIDLNLTPDSDGKVRRADGIALPFPEALDGTLLLTSDQLAPRALEGHDAVVVFADPARGIRVNVPGSREPIDVGLVAAAALGILEASGGLRLPPLVVAVVIVFLAGLFWSRAAEETTPGTAGPMALAGVAAAFVAGVVGRTAGFDLPVGGLAVAPVVAALVRAATTTSRTWTALDRLSLRIGRPVDEARIPAGIAGLADVLALYAPGSSVAAWKQAPDGSVRTSHTVAGDGTLPELQTLPATAAEGDGWLVLPVVDEGAVVGALGIARTGGLSEDERAMARAIAATRQFGRREAAVLTDPVSARLNLAQESVRRALQRAQQWEAALESSGAPLGLFDVSGGLVSAGGSVRAELGPDAVPLFQAIRKLTAQGDDVIRAALVKALAGSEEARIHARGGQDDVVVTRLGRGLAPQGLLLQVHDVTPYFGLDDIKSNVIRLLAFRTRNALVSIEGFAVMIAAEPNPEARLDRLVQLQTKVEQLVGILADAEALETTRVGETPVQPIFLPDFLAQLQASLAADGESAVAIEGPEAAEPIAATRSALDHVLRLILGDLLTKGTRVRLRVVPGTTGAEIAIEDDAGGLPDSLLGGWLHDPLSVPSRARAIVESMGGTFAFGVVPGKGLRYTLSFRYFSERSTSAAS